jgi:hypothetical protein
MKCVTPGQRGLALNIRYIQQQIFQHGDTPSRFFKSLAPSLCCRAADLATREVNSRVHKCSDETIVPRGTVFRPRPLEPIKSNRTAEGGYFLNRIERDEPDKTHFK